ncbi:PIN domain-containing protein [Persephonella sp.]|uniref:PIN domain-containing protein n=1 Tax=Persephonella sp. TaxID=2060922 RepID=UPI0025F88795|nr:PIN domain-containing protein [Persephonella sp.]
MKKFMVDSNVIIEYMKNNPEAIDIINFIKNNPSNEYYLTLDTIEEILYILVKHFSKKSYWDLKNNPEIAKNTYKKVIPLIKSILKSFFKITLQTKNTHKILFSVCEKYGLLPKDALLLAICIENDINNLITLDKDFCNLSLEESINIISTYKELEKI